MVVENDFATRVRGDTRTAERFGRPFVQVRAPSPFRLRTIAVDTSVRLRRGKTK